MCRGPIPWRRISSAGAAANLRAASICICSVRAGMKTRVQANWSSSDSQGYPSELAIAALCLQPPQVTGMPVVVTLVLSPFAGAVAAPAVMIGVTARRAMPGSIRDPAFAVDAADDAPACRPVPGVHGASLPKRGGHPAAGSGDLLRAGLHVFGYLVHGGPVGEAGGGLAVGGGAADGEGVAVVGGGGFGLQAAGGVLLE